ncbi:signal peptidase I [Candidatus Borkfalkia ceftriaxoniphila]|uniref:Signal peptidase I n=1 Tax=Candidatus Borkfalkia ceftriaxoniphila TaxID=2508949 RepID=A0A4Q2K8N1_9FIRM|nr:signal peptidase I [Candidatus Borkfalkia ceftriaxoniphila]RXZ57976.1 signal peptidase I [Candidatus Borkfalkia ceftriaxoniphila]
MRNKKVINIVVNVIVAIILVFVFILTLNIILSGDKGYTSIFGTAYVSVESNSMKGDKADNFQKGDLLKIKILDEEEKKNLQPGDVITFWDNTIVDNQLVLNSHRIIKVEKQSDGSVRYETKGDNNLDADKMLIPDVTIVGIYEGKIGGLGNVVSWFHSSTGFFVCIVLPAFLIVAYFAFNLVMVLRERNKVSDETKKERLRQELLEELRAEGKLSVGNDDEISEPDNKDQD